MDCLVNLEGFIKEQIGIYADVLYNDVDNLDALDKLYKYTFILSSIGSLDVRDVTRGLADKISTMVEEVDVGDLLKNMPKN